MLNSTFSINHSAFQVLPWASHYHCPAFPPGSHRSRFVRRSQEFPKNAKVLLSWHSPCSTGLSWTALLTSVRDAQGEDDERARTGAARRARESRLGTPRASGPRDGRAPRAQREDA